jgi:predicted nicotinamide N-methyase
LTALLGAIRREHDTELVPITIRGRTLRFFQVKDLGEVFYRRLVAGETELSGLPFWGKIWEASIFLASYLMAQPVVGERRILEIGAGMGVSGLFAATCGHQSTLSDHTEEVLRFTRANALLNDLDQVPVLRIDWRDEPPEKPYDWIVGAEVVYHQPSYDALIRFFDQALKPRGTIFLAKRTDLPATAFFALLTERFQFKRLDRVMRSGDEEYSFSLYAVRRKGEA